MNLVNFSLFHLGSCMSYCWMVVGWSKIALARMTGFVPCPSISVQTRHLVMEIVVVRERERGNKHVKCLSIFQIQSYIQSVWEDTTKEVDIRRYKMLWPLFESITDNFTLHFEEFPQFVSRFWFCCYKVNWRAQFCFCVLWSLWLLLRSSLSLMCSLVSLKYV